MQYHPTLTAQEAGRGQRLVLVADLAGVFVFAAEGAMTAIRAGLDLFGILVLAFVTALGGGLIRDLLIGDSPPASIRDWRYPLTALVAGAAVFLFHRLAFQFPASAMLVLDAAGLALFAVAGTEKALIFGLHALPAVLMGTVTAVGGGTLRDILLAQVPIILRADIYATAALLGSTLLVLGQRFGLSASLATAGGGLFCFALRLVSVWWHWNLPKAG